MKLLKDLLYGTRINEVIGSTNIAVENIAYDSRQVTGYSMFVALRGTQVDGHTYIDKAIELGAIAIVCEELPLKILPSVTYVKVTNTASSLGFISSNYYDNPSEELKLIGVTGTNGKTTSVSLLYDLFKKQGYKVGLLSTVINKIHNEEIASTHTTPNALEINKLLREMLEQGVSHCFMEVSSHAVHQKRIEGLHFTGGIFTNITHDHLDYHGSFDEYVRAKKGFFDRLPSNAFALVNKDDPHWESIVHETKAKIITYGIKTAADYKAKIIENHFSGLQLIIDNSEVWSKLIGGFNAYNLLVAYSAAILLGEDKLEVLTIISSLNPVEGRFQHLKTDSGITAIIDYAHTPDALKNVLSTIKEIRTGNELVITIVGCGGDRDKEKRPLMAAIACEMSDHVIFTSDNPRSENPEQIIKDMEKGVEPVYYKKTISVVNRKEAIKMACTMAKAGDIMLVAGKGHEKYQEIKGEILPFDDFQVVEETLKIMEK